MNGTSSEEQRLYKELRGSLLAVREVLKEEGGFSGQTWGLAFFKCWLGIVESPPLLLDTGYDDPDDLPGGQEEAPAP